METPKAIENGLAHSDLESTAKHPYVVFAGMTLRHCRTPVEISGFPVLRFEGSEVANGPILMSASFFDQQGRPSLFIRRNEWRVHAGTWDVEAVGGKVTVRSGSKLIALKLAFDPGEGVIVERIHMYCGGYFLDGDQGRLEITNKSGGKYTFTGCVVDNCQVGLSLN